MHRPQVGLEPHGGSTFFRAPSGARLGARATAFFSGVKSCGQSGSCRGACGRPRNSPLTPPSWLPATCTPGRWSFPTPRSSPSCPLRTGTHCLDPGRWRPCVLAWRPTSEKGTPPHEVSGQVSLGCLGGKPAPMPALSPGGTGDPCEGHHTDDTKAKPVWGPRRGGASGAMEFHGDRAPVWEGRLEHRQ